MKKLFIVIFAALMLALSGAQVLAFEVDWEEDFVGEIGKISLPEASPTVDGVISEDEGWSEPKYFDKTNTEGAWGGQDVDVFGDLYRAYDADYLYIAANINIPEYSLCEGEDWIEGGDRGDLPGWDGDVFILSLDPMQALLNEGFGTDPAAWYCIGLFDGGVVRTYRTHLNDKEITDLVLAKGNVTEGGWMFEAAIPWKTICDDVAELSQGFAEFEPEDILKKGNIISASMIYYDRRYDPEAEQRITHSRYVTVATEFPDGTPGVMGTPWTIQAHGIFLEVDPLEKADAPENDPIQKDPVQNDTLNEGNNESREPAVNKENAAANGQENAQGSAAPSKQESKKPVNSATTNSSAAQTFDAGISVMLSVLCASGAGVAYFRKRK